MFASFQSWFQKPFSSDMSAVDWFLFVGLLVVITGLWAMIFRHIKDA